MESEWAMFRASIVEAAAWRSRQKAVGACRGGNLRTRWWTPAVKEAIRLKKVGPGSPETAGRYREVRRAAASAIAEAKTWVWEEFGEAMEKDFRLGVLANRPATQEGKAGLGSGHAQSGRTADPD